MRLRRCILAVAALGVVTGPAAIAQDKPKATGVVAVRQATMKANADHMAAIKAILSEYPEVLDQVQFHAQAIQANADHTVALFPEGSTQPASAALPAIWSDQAGFKTAAQRAEELAAKLVETSKGGDAKAMLAAFAELGKNGCGGCHQNFRRKEES